MDIGIVLSHILHRASSCSSLNYRNHNNRWIADNQGNHFSGFQKYIDIFYADMLK